MHGMSSVHVKIWVLHALCGDSDNYGDPGGHFSLKSVATSLKSVATSLKSVATSLKSVVTSLKSVATSLKSVAISLKSVVSSLWLSNSVFAGGIHFSSKEGTLFLPF